MSRKSVTKLRKTNNHNEKKISKESEEIYTDMIVYLRFSDITLLQQELVRSDLIQMIIDGEERGENIEEILGGDYKKICDEIITAFPPKTKKDKFLQSVSIFTMSFSIILLIYFLSQFIPNLIQGSNQGTFDFRASYFIIFPLLGLVVYFSIKFISNVKFKQSTPQKNNTKEFLLAWLSLSIFVAITVFLETVLDQVLFEVSVFIVLGIILILFSISYGASLKMDD